MTKFTVDASELKEILRMVKVDYEDCMEEGCNFIGLHLIVESNRLIVLFDADEYEIEPWTIELDENTGEDLNIDRWDSFQLEEWAVLELIKVFEETEDTDKMKVIIDVENEKLLIEKHEETLEYKLW